VPLPEQPNRLLVVDDDFASRTALSKRLKGRGYTVDTADGGVAALDKILHDHYDLILLDERMPEMSGLDLLRLLRATHSETDLPVIMVTGVDDKSSIVDALHEGANDYVIKPVEMPEILARIQTQLTRAARTRLKGSDTERDPPADAFWEWDPISGVAQFTRPWKEMVASAHQEIGTGLNEWFDRVHPQHLLEVRGDFQEFVDGAIPEFRSEHRLRLSTGQYRWVIFRAGAIRNSEGQVVRVSGSLTDIDRRKTIDPLTGLGNRQHLHDSMSSALAAAPEAGEARLHAWMVLLVDVDGFHNFNASFGRAAGDRLLVCFAERLRSALAASPFSEGSTLVRCGGDEFAVLAPCAGSAEAGCNIVDARHAEVLAELLQAALSQSRTGEEDTGHVSTHIGVALSDTPAVTLDQMLMDAELALKVARADGPHGWHVSTSALREHTRLRAATTRDFRHAVDRHQLVAFYQPQMDLLTRKLVGFEALMRWRHPERGLLPPSEFIDIAEETGMIVAAGEWILRDACCQLRLWQDQFPSHPPLIMSVNLSPRQLSNPNLLPRLHQILEETGIPPTSLHLELTESCAMDETEAARDVLTAIRATGVHLNLDDFGTGYASLAYLKVIHFDALKIDRSFVSRMESDEESFAIIKTILGLAQELRMDVVAEGIETEVQLQHLINLGCKCGQGFYFAKPVDAHIAGEMLRWSAQHPPMPELFVA